MLDREDWAQANAAKFAGYQAGLILAGRDTGRELVRLVPVRDCQAAVDRALEELWAPAARPTALVCFNDAPALAVLDWLGRRGLAPGRDLSLIGSGDSAYRQGLCRTLSSIRVHFRRMGEIAALEALCDRRNPQMRAVIVPNRLKLRASVGPPPSAPAGPACGR
jgi:LacI family transcriptional regulator